MLSNAIEIRKLSKSYGKVKALDTVDLTVGTGELFGLVGPDGAGKTTLFRLLATLLDPDGGNARLGIHNIRKDAAAIRSSIGYMPGRFSLYPDLTVEENLNFFASVFGVDFQESLDLISPIFSRLEPFRSRRAGRLSGGMKQKLALCCAMVHRPDILLLDEPTTGVDAVSRTEFWDVLDFLCQKGMTIMVSTPYMDEAARCSHIALMNNGHILQTGTPQEIISGFDAEVYRLSADEMYPLLSAVRKQPETLSCYPAGEAHHLVVALELDQTRFQKRLEEAGFHNVRIDRIKPQIEDVFIKLMQ